ncbi:tRNA pseudouridine synthase A [Paramicrobacterium agarici]|uniref:tRNA pseudouridine synthase A n=1 Tax=Paramicrobacterium agarici TaxID=630514 RepID=UPI001168C158|nr:tRNA pseudouridine synthase A [Microbacterium agarici]TQO22003.1 tRNA pseudouridine38-40 synthase [Microbacterium agarici]
MIDQHPDATRFRLDIAYDGTDFKGWARQPGLRTVQGVLEDAIARLFGRRGDEPGLTVAGRTDAGVHATGQVAHIDLLERHVDALKRQRRRDAVPQSPGEVFTRRVDGVLGRRSDVVVTSASEAPAGFDARFSASWRRYEYRVADDVTGRNPLERNTIVWRPGVLDVDAMDAAARELVGLHDFGAYCKPREGATTIRTLQDFCWRRDDAGRVIAEVRADAFCHSMVRSLVGACVAVGEGRLSAAELVQIRDAAERTSSFTVMPAHGLTLVQVGYPEDDLLAARAELTKAKRTLD